MRKPLDRGFPDEVVETISAVHLRPEPRYWFHEAQSRNEKEDRVREAIRRAPRPFILYVTTREESARWIRILRNTEGYQRIEKFDGSTPNNFRKKIIDAWATNQIDGIVATSAFGVGIDKSDVKTIHFYIFTDMKQLIFRE